MDPQTNPQPATPPVNAVSPPQVPESWPGAFGIYKFSKEVVKPNLGALIAVYVLLIVLSIAVEILFKHDGSVYALVYNIVSALLSAFFTGATVCLWLASVKGQKMSFSEAAKSAMAHLLNLFVLAILTYLALGLSLILLIIPFFFVLPRISLAPYYLIDKNLGPIDALKASWAETKGHAGKVWGIYGVTLLIVLLMVTIIGIPFAIYFYLMYSAAIALLYTYIQKHPAQATAAATQTAPLPAPQQQPQPQTDTAPTPPVSTPPAV